MKEGYLRSRVVRMTPAEEEEQMEGVVTEALLAKAARENGVFEFELLGPKALDHRVRLGLKSGEYTGGCDRRLRGHTDVVIAIVECEGLVCSWSWDGWIRVWGRQQKSLSGFL
jgi:hypothetical protein